VKAVRFGARGEPTDDALADLGYDVVAADLERPDALTGEIADADLLTVAVDASSLLAVAVPVALGLRQRLDLDLDAQWPPMVILVADGGSADLENEVRALLPESAADSLDSFARFTDVLDRD
jgi:hypothetical protein